MTIVNTNSNGHQDDYNPDVEFEYLAADVWFKETSEGKEIAYSEEVLEALQDEEENEPNGDSDSN